MTALRSNAFLLCAVLLCACTKEVPPRTVTEFMDDQLLLEAVLLRCTENRAESRYDAECVNAREAVKLLEARETQARQAELEALSERKREALRRTQQAAAEARRRASALEKQREEIAYQAQFGIPMPGSEPGTEAMQGNEPVAVIPPPAAGTQDLGADPTVVTPAPELPAPAPSASVTEGAGQSADLGAVREELRRRNESSDAGDTAESAAETTAEATE